VSPLPWLFLLAGLVTLDARIIAPVLPAISASLGVSPGQVGLAVTAYAIGYGVLQLVYGPLSDRHGRVRVIRATALLFAVGTAASGLAGSVPGFVAARLFTGMVAAATIPITFTYIGDTVPYTDRQRVVGHLAALTSSAQALSASLAGIATYLVSWRIMFLGYAVLTVVPTVMLLRAPEARRPAAPPAPVPYATILGLPRARRIYAAVLAEGFLVMGGMTYLGVLASQRYGFNNLQIGLLLACSGLGTIAGGLSLGRVGLGLGERTLAAHGGLLQGLGWVLLAVELPWPAFAAALLTLGFGFSWVHTTLQTRATELFPSARGKAFALFPLGFFLGGAMGSGLFAPLVDAGLIRWVMAACASGLAATGFLAAREA
jgi:predicted MFS family arabinose efflux permease